MNELCAGGLAGGVGILVCQPVDTVRIRLQHDRGSVFKSLGRIMRQEGAAGLYKGVASPLVTCGIMNAVLFFTYEYTMRNISQGRKRDMSDVFIAGAASGFTASFINSPTELVKIRAQVDRMTLAPLQQFKKEWSIAKAVRFKGELSKGIWLTIVRDAPSVGLYFGVYEYIIQTFGSGFLTQLAAGGAAGGIAWTCVYPIDVLKTRWQSKLSQQSFKTFIRAQTWVSLWDGYVATMYKAIPQNAVIFLVYSQLRK